MAFDFPTSPATGQQITGPNGVVWQYDGVKWTTGSNTGTALITVGIANDIVSALPLGTYDLGPVTQSGTIVNSYAHVTSGTLTYSAATGSPGTYTPVTGMTTLTSNSTTVDTVGTATAANVLTAGKHLYCIVGGTAAPGATVYFTVKVP